MSEYREDNTARCEGCGARAPLDFGHDGRQLCRKCAARATVAELSDRQWHDQRFNRMIASVEKAAEDYEKSLLLRRCPTCGPTMVGKEYRHVGASSRGNVSGVTYEGKFECGKCGRKVSIFPTRPALLRAVFVVGFLVATPFVNFVARYLLLFLFCFLGLFALIDLIQRIRYPVVRK